MTAESASGVDSAVTNILLRRYAALYAMLVVLRVISVVVVALGARIVIVAVGIQAALLIASSTCADTGVITTVGSSGSSCTRCSGDTARACAVIGSEERISA